MPSDHAPSHPENPWLRRLTGWPAAVVLALLYWAMAVLAVREKSLTFDEGLHLTPGYAYWVHNDYRLGPMSGNLPMRLAALPLVLGPYRFPDLHQEAWWKGDNLQLTHQFLHLSGNDLGGMLWRARAMVALVGAGLGLLVYAWSRRLFGPVGGMLSLLLFAFSPTMLAHGALATSDMVATFAFTATLLAFAWLLERLTLPRVALAGLALGALMLSKMSGPLVLPVLALLAIGRALLGPPLEVGFGGRAPIAGRGARAGVLLASLLAACLIAWAVIWAGFGFRFAAFHVEAPDPGLFHAKALEQAGPRPLFRDAIELLYRSRLVPECFGMGLGHVLSRAGVRPTFVDGHYSVGGVWWFFPYAFLVKTPLPLLAVVLAGLGALLWARRPDAGQAAAGPGPGSRLWATAPLWLFAIVYLAVAIRSGLNIGHRHLLPIYPALFILAGAAGWWLDVRAAAGRWLARACLGGLVAWLVVESLAIRPHYLAYFNQLAGGPAQGYRRLVDSSLDWGQDLPGLQRWIDQHTGVTSLGRRPRVYLSYFGLDSPDYYGIDAQRLPSNLDLLEPRHGWARDLHGGFYCISATSLQMLAATRAQIPPDDALRRRTARLCARLLEREPDAEIGYSILIYKLTDQQVRDATVE